ncbi:MAG: c-type cytochrome [Pyrinomonadaceae bacterium]
MTSIKMTRLKLAIASTPIIFMLAVAFGYTPRSSMANASPEAAPFFDSGADYVAQCTRCHGGDGRGQTAKGRQTHAGDLTKSSVSDAKGIRMITNGSGEMPAFKNSLSAEQIRGVMNYVKGFRH